jgi:hypothetical protein
MSILKPYQDHVRMWESELRGWMPDKLFDAHVHLGPPAAMNAIRDPLRLTEAKTTFTSFSAEELFSFYESKNGSSTRLRNTRA